MNHEDIAWSGDLRMVGYRFRCNWCDFHFNSYEEAGNHNCDINGRHAADDLEASRIASMVTIS